MAISKKKNKIARNLFQRMRKLSQSTLKAVVNWVLRALLKRGKRPRLAKAGFALPTTIMVLLVVTLLTTTLVLRSMDRNRNAINARSEQVIQNNATPALDRARAKLSELLIDPELPRGTPSDDKLLEVMADERYTFGDETRLKVAYDLDGDNNIENSEPNAKTDETLNTVWRYPVDTDGNGKFDAFTLYGMYWRNPARDSNDPNQYADERKPLEARSVPQDTVGIGEVCKSAGLAAATAVEGSDWFKQGGNLSKSFYVYAATVPITDTTQVSPEPYLATQFETNKKGNKAFSGLEYQQDRYRSGLNNTSVWYQDDLVLSPGDPFRVNGRIFTNGNLLVGGGSDKPIEFFQVSDPYSCFYEKANAKINVGGNVVHGDLTTNNSAQPVLIDLFKGKETDPAYGATAPRINAGQQSTSNQGSQVAYNDAAYTQRINLMKQTALSFCSTCTPEQSAADLVNDVKNVTQYPADLITSLEESIEQDDSQPYTTLSKEIEAYLRSLTRRVPYAEVPIDGSVDPLQGYTPDPNTGLNPSVFVDAKLDPPTEWREPTNTNTKLTLVTNKLDQSNPENIKKQNDPEKEIGDRINVGNNLPALWKKEGPGEYSAPDPGEATGSSWSDGGDRYRQTQMQEQEDVGDSSRAGYWEQAAAANPAATDTSYAGGGGLRVITGAGIYVDGLQADGASFPRDGLPSKSSFLQAPSWDTNFVQSDGTKFVDGNSVPIFRTKPNIAVWPDLMPMTGGADETDLTPNVSPNGATGRNRKGDLLMRATAVYHYVDFSLNPDDTPDKQLPIACVSSYYDPTDKNTARNPVGLPDVSGGINTTGNEEIEELFDGTFVADYPQPPAGVARSNNGVVYPFPGRDQYQAILLRQAQLAFPDGRAANQPLRTALSKAKVNYTLADYSAIDTAICAIGILNGMSPNNATGNGTLPHGAIKESSFLDAREVRAIDKLTPIDANYDINKNYDLPLEERQPLEVRVTDIDLRVLAQTEHGNPDSNNDGDPEQEYLLPNSGIIYASRDDALPDLSDQNERVAAETSPSVSATDFKLDPTRRPNGIRLINGLRLARGTGNSYDNKTEKGLILATNAPAYVKGHLNVHLASDPSKTFNAGDPELEEFVIPLNSSWTNFYSRGDSAGNNLQKQFACRKGQPKCQGEGDQWRPATIISDAISLQSENYKEGYRNQGDFDLRNNGGGVSEGNQVGNGFFNNSFVTSADWFDPTTNLPKNTTDPDNNTLVSYLVNGVTPIQRRANVMAYRTEMCTQIPISSCQPSDWSTPNPPPTPIPDTATIATGPEQRYARRVEFVRAPGTNQYYYDPTTGYPEVRQKTTVQPNALWFQTLDAAGDPSFNGSDPINNDPVIFQPPEVPELGALRGYLAASPSGSKTMDKNNIAAPVTALGPAPAATVITQLGLLYNEFATTLPTEDFAQNKVNSLQLLAGRPLPLDTDQKIDLTGGGRMTVYTAGNIFMNANRPLTLKGDAGSVFVFIVSGQLNVNGANALILDGVVPENVYWIISGPVTVGANAQLRGNVLTPSQITLRLGATLEGRALSSSSVSLRPAIGSQPGASIVAPGGNHPRLVPVTQIHSPDPDSVPAAALDPRDPNTYRNYWLQQPVSTNYNAAFVVGDSPNRPGEFSAGLHNLVRFQENWSPEGKGTGQGVVPTDKQTATIKGSFIQIQRSSYATGPFGMVRTAVEEPILTGANQLSIFDYAPNKYHTSVGQGVQPYYSPPIRQWGFDVGLLSQTPDLFSQRFTENISKTQNYYRQVGRDDPWIKTLLCAAEPTNPTDPAERNGTKPGTQYNRNYAVPASERPQCDDWVGADIGDYPANPN